MSDKRDIHKAKSHRNSRNKSTQQKATTRAQATPPNANTTTMTDPMDESPTKRNKSRR